MTSNELEIFKQSILDDVRVMMQTTGQVTQYIGARYVPLFAEPLDWSAEREYEPLTIVLDHGNSFTSRQFVPKGIDISNESFWANTGNYNAQIEQYRQEVRELDGRVTANTQAIAAEIARAESAEETLSTNVDKLSVFVTPEMYGAVGDGIQDDTKAIQNALNAGKPTVFTKTYKVSKALKGTNSIYGISGCSIICTNVNDCGIYYDNKTNFVVSGITVIGCATKRDTTGSFTKSSFAFNNCSNFTVTKCEGSKNSYLCMQLVNCSHFHVDNCYLHDTFADGIHLAGSNNGTVQNCHTKNTGDDSIGCVGYSESSPVFDIVVSNNVITQSVARACSAVGWVHDITFTDNVISILNNGQFFIANSDSYITGSATPYNIGFISNDVTIDSTNTFPCTFSQVKQLKFNSNTIRANMDNIHNPIIRIYANASSVTKNVSICGNTLINVGDNTIISPIVSDSANNYDLASLNRNGLLIANNVIDKFGSMAIFRISSVNIIGNIITNCKNTNGRNIDCELAKNIYIGGNVTDDDTANARTIYLTGVSNYNATSENNLNYTVQIV